MINNRGTNAFLRNADERFMVAESHASTSGGGEKSCFLAAKGKYCGVIIIGTGVKASFVRESKCFQM